MSSYTDIKAQILKLTKEFYNLKYINTITFSKNERIPYAGRVFDHEEMISLVDASLDFWLTAGRYAEQFESKLAEFLGIRFCSLTNSGSSANLLAFMALTSNSLGDKRIKKGDEVITLAASFPTTVNPIIQYGAVPVFVDVAIPQYNIDIEKIDSALSRKTKAVFIAHTLGNPFNLERVMDFCLKNNLWLIEDNCDALGSKYLYKGEAKYTGTIGHLGTSSFYPPHHITMGEGGAVYTNDANLKRLVDSFRDWGRDCFCPPGVDNSCKNRFNQQFGELPVGYDHKFVYSHFGYNLKATDMQAAVGCAQLKKLPDFIKKRQENWNYLKRELSALSDYIILPEPEPNSEPSWFGFLMTLKESVKYKRDRLANYLEKNGIQTRNLFAGNLIKHPCFDEMRETSEGYRICGSLVNTDIIMNNSIWIGVYPGLSNEALDFIIKKIREYFN